ncbi:MAG: DUF6493 family protein [Oscillospiraceae bacterium]|jgi:hypothetical protein|nr:DUF6493 family protein [Oscillospiraceae bacterium]
MNQKLEIAVGIFKELGWENATAENVLTLPLGTPEQKRRALDGLKSGEWGKFGNIAKNTYGWISDVDVEESMLALFAIRVGVDARRAANILRGGGADLPVAVIAGRGAKYAADFITHACVSRRRGSEHALSAFGVVAVRLVDRLNLDIPQSAEYMKDWSWCADIAMRLDAQPALDGVSQYLKFDRRHNRTDLPDLESIKRRFAEHIVTGVAVNVPATGFFGMVFAAGAKLGWVPRAKAIELAFAALDAAARPGDRKVWLSVLDELSVADEELHARAQALIPLLSSGEAAMVTRLAPTLIAGADGELLTEILLAAFSVTTKKTRQLVLKSALERPRPENAAELSPWLSILAGDKDKSVAGFAARLSEKWAITAAVLPEEQSEIRGLWRETPPVWQAPAFVLGDATPESLTELAAEMMRRPAFVHDVAGERFLAMANAVARQNPETARMSLRGLRSDETPLSFAVCWVKGQEPSWGFDTEEKRGIKGLFTARDYGVFLRLGELPCLLSTPSFEDLSISVPDLAARLTRYQEAGTNALEADLFLALTRLAINTQTPEAVQALRQIKTPLLLQSGETMPLTAGQAALRYLDDPIKEAPMDLNQHGWYTRVAVSPPDSLRDFPERLDHYLTELFSLFPHWGDVALRDVRWNDEVYHAQGLIMRQIARRAAPLPPGASVNFMASLRSLTPDAAADALLAVTEAWERGLLRPGVADVAFLDWSTKPPSNLAALAAALAGVAADGLLSVVWPVLDEIIGAALKAPRLVAGTAELVELMLALLPEVEAAIAKGLADNTALALPCVRALARRAGSSRAVTAAQKLAGLLPFAEPPKAEDTAPTMETPFDMVWPQPQNAAQLIEDGVTVAVAWASEEKKQLLFTLTLPGITDRVFQINSSWTYPMEAEGQCQAYTADPGTLTLNRVRENTVWLHWDTVQKKMTVGTYCNWVDENDNTLNLKTIQAPPLSFSLLTVVVGLLAQDGDAVYSAPRTLRKCVESGQIDDKIVHRASQILLQFPVISPAKLVRCLEKDLRLLPMLWPVFTESLKSAGMIVAGGNPPPVWVNRILDNALRYAPYLAEAAKRGLIPAEDAKWVGLSEIAASKAKSTAVAKAKKLLTFLK